jgi:transposase
MVEAQTLSQQERVEQVQHVTKTEPDPRVRRRAHGALLVEQGQSLAQVARCFGPAPQRGRAWQERLLSAGRAGLADQAGAGRPPKLDAAARALLSEALERGPPAYGLPVTLWTLDDLQTLLLREREVPVRRARLYRVRHPLGSRSRRPRHDLTHRQQAVAVATARRLLERWHKNQVLSPDASLWSIATNVQSMPMRTWRRSGARTDRP